MDQQEGRPALGFIADDQALDFLNSIAAPRGTEFDWLSDGNDLLIWLCESGLITNEEVNALNKSAKRTELDETAAKARKLREWFRTFVHIHLGKSINKGVLAKLEPLNKILAQDNSFPQITVGQSGKLELSRQQHFNSPDMLLVPIAEAMGTLVTNVDFKNVKNCEGPTCSMLFHDISKNRKRRWCSMAVCGNRAKAAAHRARKKPEN